MRFLDVSVAIVAIIALPCLILATLLLHGLEVFS